jgi:hypothetical protein
MKRPRIFYVVAVWSCLALLIQASYLARPSRAYQAAGEAVPVLWTILPLVALGFVIWQTVGLVQLKRFNRWFAVVYFIWWAIALIWNSTAALLNPAVKPLPAIALFSVLVALNLLSAWYLSRQSFREFAVEFRVERDKILAERDKEKHSRMMQKVCQKKILDDVQR